MSSDHPALGLLPLDSILQYTVMKILTLLVIDAPICLHQFPDVIPATAAQLDSEQRPVTGTTSSDISVQSATRDGKSKMKTDQIEAISEFERSRDTLNLQASSSPPPTASPAAPPTRTLELSPAIASLALAPPSFDLSPIGVSNGVPTPQPARIVIGFPSIVLNPIGVFSTGVPTLKPVNLAFPGIVLNPSVLSPIGVSTGVPSLKPVTFSLPSIVLNPIFLSPIGVSSSFPTLAPYPVSVPNGPPTIAFGILNVIQVRLD